MERNTTIDFPCFPTTGGVTSLVILLLAFPFHTLMIKILVKDVGLLLPRHHIMLTLSISDALQVFLVAIVSSITFAADLTTKSVTCTLIRHLLVFGSSLTVVVSSLALVTIAAERMIICMHFLKYRRLFRRTRVLRLMRSYWLVGMIMAAIVTVTKDAQKTEASVSGSTSFQVVSSLVILLSALIITVIYFRIFLFSRYMIMRITPSPFDNNLRDEIVFKRKQIRIAAIAGIVCMSYVVFMVPIAVNYILRLAGVIHTHSASTKGILGGLALINTIADPFIYGFGMTQTRQILIRMVKKVLPGWH